MVFGNNGKSKTVGNGKMRNCSFKLIDGLDHNVIYNS